MTPAASDGRLPDGFAVRLDPRTRRRAGGRRSSAAPRCACCGSPRARESCWPATGWSSGTRTTAALAAGCSTPGWPIPTCPTPPPTTSPWSSRSRTAPAALTACSGPARRPGDRAPPGRRGGRRVGGARWPAGRPGGPAPPPAARRPRGTPGCGWRRRHSWPSSTPTACPRPAGWSGSGPTSTTPRLAVVAPRIVACPAADAAGSPLRDRGQSPSTWAPPRRRVRPGSARLLRAQRRAACPPVGARRRVRRGHARRRGRRPRLAADRGRLAGALRAGAAVAHEHPATTAEWLRRRAFYGTGAALLAARHGPRSRRW